MYFFVLLQLDGQFLADPFVFIHFTRVHDDVIKWKHFPRHRPFVRGNHRLPVNYPHKSQWRGALMFSLIYAWINGWVNTREAGDLIRHRAHYDVTVMTSPELTGTMVSYQTETKQHKVRIQCINLGGGGGAKYICFLERLWIFGGAGDIHCDWFYKQ